MDINKEREVFEAWVGSNGRSIERFSDSSYKSMTLDKEWEAWQAAKAQAVPEGFVLVSKEPTKQYKDVISQYLDELWMGEWGCDWDGFICVNGIDLNHVWKIVTDTKAMIEAQEQTND